MRVKRFADAKPYEARNHRGAGGEENVLGPMNSCTIAPDEAREIVNRDHDICKMLVVIPYPPGVKP